MWALQRRRPLLSSRLHAIKDDKSVVIGMMWYVGAPDANERIQGLIQERS